MESTEFAVRPESDLSKAADVIERVCLDLGLEIAMKGSLRQFPGSVHWHFRHGREKGTLELTLLVSERRIWANVHANRRGAWIEPMLPRLRKGVEGGIKRA